MNSRNADQPQTPQDAARPRFATFSALRYRDFRLLWIGLVVSALGTWMQVIAQSLLVLIGGLTAVLAALVMMTRISIKVRLAWSTCAQMGLMLLECGLGLYELALVHLLAHSLYKAHAFLAAGETVAVFPEGTTGPGYPLLPLHGNLLQAAISTHTPLQPVVLRWHQPGQPYSEAAQYIGQMTLMESLWRILTAKDLAVEVRSLPAMPTEGLDRRHLAEALAERLSNALPRP